MFYYLVKVYPKIKFGVSNETQFPMKIENTHLFHCSCRILEEESAKRQILERLQAEQGQQLLKEQMSRQELEEAHKQQEEAFRLAREQLEALAKERQQADEQLRVK